MSSSAVSSSSFSSSSNYVVDMNKEIIDRVLEKAEFEKEIIRLQQQVESSWFQKGAYERLLRSAERSRDAVDLEIKDFQLELEQERRVQHHRIAPGIYLLGFVAGFVVWYPPFRWKIPTKFPFFGRKFLGGAGFPGAISGENHHYTTRLFQGSVVFAWSALNYKLYQDRDRK